MPNFMDKEELYQVAWYLELDLDMALNVLKAKG